MRKLRGKEVFGICIAMIAITAVIKAIKQYKSNKVDEEINNIYKEEEEREKWEEALGCYPDGEQCNDVYMRGWTRRCEECENSHCE